tara:strand:- start:216 stop:356 length:141 start_codon:yes stop_codon:yes gene_type:complete
MKKIDAYHGLIEQAVGGIEGTRDISGVEDTTEMQGWGGNIDGGTKV